MYVKFISLTPLFSCWLKPLKFAVFSFLNHRRIYASCHVGLLWEQKKRDTIFLCYCLFLHICIHFSLYCTTTSYKAEHCGAGFQKSVIYNQNINSHLLTLDS